MHTFNGTVSPYCSAFIFLIEHRTCRVYSIYFLNATNFFALLHSYFETECFHLIISKGTCYQFFFQKKDSPSFYRKRISRGTKSHKMKNTGVTSLPREHTKPKSYRHRKPTTTNKRTCFPQPASRHFLLVGDEQGNIVVCVLSKKKNIVA